MVGCFFVSGFRFQVSGFRFRVLVYRLKKLNNFKNNLFVLCEKLGAFALKFTPSYTEFFWSGLRWESRTETFHFCSCSWTCLCFFILIRFSTFLFQTLYLLSLRKFLRILPGFKIRYFYGLYRCFFLVMFGDCVFLEE